VFVNTRFVILAILTVGLYAGAGQVFGHHGTGISYDLANNPITLKGTVTEYRWANPHVSVFIDVKDETGKVVNWALEGAGIGAYLQRGFSRNTLKPGMEVTALLIPPASAANSRVGGKLVDEPGFQDALFDSLPPTSACEPRKLRI
jgi:hypothetical protein